MKNAMKSILFATALVAGACGDDDESIPDAAGNPDAMETVDAGTPDAGPDPVARGEYLVNHVALCTGCHTPVDMMGQPIMAQYLAGVECFIDVDPMDPNFGCLSSKNLTNHSTGLMNRTDQEIKDMFMNGMRPNGEVLNNVMPYWVFHNMTEEDADAIVAYLRTVTGVDHMLPADQAPFDNPVLSNYLDPQDIPAGADASAERGRYLAAMAGLCIECHTQRTAPGTSMDAIDLTKLFAGGEGFPAAAFGLPVPPFPDVIYTVNLTPHATTGLQHTEQEIINVLENGVDPDGMGVCPPMPGGMPFFAGMTDEDQADIAHYIKGLPPIDNAIPNECAVPGM